MEDRLLVEALRSRDPGALAAVYDEYADRLYAYCWSHLLHRDAAQVALRDTFIVAEAHIEKLREIDRFAPWIYAIARIECARRMPLPGQQPDLPIASHDQDDVDQRLLAWQAVRTLTPIARETLELRVLHQLAISDFALVLDRPVRDVQQLLDDARTALRTALTAEILVRAGGIGCDGRGAILAERDGGELDPGLRELLAA
ncbi:RNA polymerase sigma factor, partial [Actinocorallia lasiicapitis]